MSNTEIEIESKWLVDDLEKARREILRNGWSTISQAYLPSTDRNTSTRIRVTEDKSELTTKIRISDLSVKEINTTVDRETSLLILEHLGNVITKERFNLSDGYTLDIFQGELEGLAIIEKEYESEEELQADTPPSWFGKNVTGDPTYINANLGDKKYQDGSIVDK